MKKVSPIEGIKNLVEICDKMNHPVGNVIYQKEVTFEEVNVETNIRNYCESKNIKVTEIWGSSLYNKAGNAAPVINTFQLSLVRLTVQRPRLHPGHLHPV